LAHLLKSQQSRHRHNKGRILRIRSPAVAGFLFLLFLSHADSSPDTPQLSASGQLYVRRFIEQFAPLIVQNERHSRRLNFRWDLTNRDCAGLVRYVFHEALSPHRESFFAHYPELYRLGNYPNQGELSRARRYWNTGNQTTPDLLQHTRYIGRQTGLQNLKTGDIVYYESSELRVRHLMLVVRSGRGIFLFYHTGDQRDELRLRTVEDLRRMEVPHWHPDADNPAFRGVYRPAFLQ
jgi:uncharacterized protein YfaT (DUF1175 family)